MLLHGEVLTPFVLVEAHSPFDRPKENRLQAYSGQINNVGEVKNCMAAALCQLEIHVRTLIDMANT
jgi:hypothetical protein